MISSVFLLIGIILLIIELSKRTYSSPVNNTDFTLDIFNSMFLEQSPWVGQYRDNSIKKYNN
jgi:hypothetical protein